MARALGVRGPLELLTNNPEKADAVAAALANEKIEVRTTLQIEGSSSPFNRDYLWAKRRSGHALSRRTHRSAALPPEYIEVEPPRRAIGHPHLLSTASYLLPVEFGADSPARESVEWFRMRVIYDLRTARESVLLSLGEGTDSTEGASATMMLVDRLPRREATGRQTLYRALSEIRGRREGRVVVHFDDSDPTGDPMKSMDRASREVLSREIMAAEWAPAPTDLTGNGRDAER